MPKLEKKIKQKITTTLEDNCTQYLLEFSLQKSSIENRRISKNQYKYVNNLQDVDSFTPKFPCTLTLTDNPRQALLINKKSKIIIPEYFQLKNKNFSLKTHDLLKNLYTLKVGLILLYKTIYLILEEGNTDHSIQQ